MKTPNPMFTDEWGTAGPQTNGPERDWYTVEPGRPVDAKLLAKHHSLWIGHETAMPTLKVRGDQAIVCGPGGVVSPAVAGMNQLVYVGDADGAVVDVNVAAGPGGLLRPVYAKGVTGSILRVRAIEAYRQAAMVLRDVSHSLIDGDVRGALEYGGGGRGYGPTTSAGCEYNVFTGLWKNLRHHLPIQDHAKFNVVCGWTGTDHTHDAFKNGGPGSLEFHDASSHTLVIDAVGSRCCMPGNSGPITDTTIAASNFFAPMNIGDGSDRINLFGVKFIGTHAQLLAKIMPPNGKRDTPRAWWENPDVDPYADTGLGPGVMVEGDAGSDLHRSDKLPDELLPFLPETFLDWYTPPAGQRSTVGGGNLDRVKGELADAAKAQSPIGRISTRLRGIADRLGEL